METSKKLEFVSETINSSLETIFKLERLKEHSTLPGELEKVLENLKQKLAKDLILKDELEDLKENYLQKLLNRNKQETSDVNSDIDVDSRSENSESDLSFGHTGSVEISEQDSVDESDETYRAVLQEIALLIQENEGDLPFLLNVIRQLRKFKGNKDKRNLLRNLTGLFEREIDDGRTWLSTVEMNNLVDIESKKAKQFDGKK